MNGPAVPLLTAESAPLLTRPAFADGDPGPIVAALAHVPEVLEATLPFLGTVLGPSALDLRTKEICILRTSARASCRYCVESHTVVALDAGLSVDEVRALRDDDGAVSDAFPTETDQALIAWCDTMVGVGPVDAAARRRLLGVRADQEVVEITLLVATTLLLNRFCTSLDLPTSPEVLVRLANEGLTA